MDKHLRTLRHQAEITFIHLYSKSFGDNPCDPEIKEEIINNIKKELEEVMKK
jgi:hypothetical protein